jgi:serine/threonine-protein kinase
MPHQLPLQRPARACPGHWPPFATIAALIAIALAWRFSGLEDRPLMRISMDLGPDAVICQRLTAAISPDGKSLVYVIRTSDGKQVLATRAFDQTAAAPLPSTEGASDPFFSPDGEWIGYLVGRRLMKIPAPGGAPLPICNVPSVRGATWGEDGTIIIGTASGGLFHVPAAGGAAQPLTDASKQGHRSDRWPQFLPGSDAVLYTGQVVASSFDSDVMLLNLKTGRIKSLFRAGYNARYFLSGHLVYLQRDSLFAVRFDLSRLEPRFSPSAWRTMCGQYGVWRRQFFGLANRDARIPGREDGSQ